MKIVTSHIHPVIPRRDHDWCAFVEGCESECGFGRTQAEAIDDLRGCHPYGDDGPAITIEVAGREAAPVVRIICVRDGSRVCQVRLAFPAGTTDAEADTYVALNEQVTRTMLDSRVNYEPVTSHRSRRRSP